MIKRARTLRILVADDHELVRRGIRAILQAQRGWKVVAEVADGREAVAKAKELKPHLAILDIKMPELDGLEATRQLRDLAPETSILILTMHDSDQMVHRVLEAGARGYVLKSDLADQLVKAVEEVFRGKIFLTPKVSEIVLEGFLKASAESSQTDTVRAQPTPREREVIRLLAEGKSNKEISTALGIAVRTAETHRANIMLKLGLRSLPELVHYAIRNALISVQQP